MATDRKIPITEFCTMTGKKPKGVYTLFAKHPGLKAQVPGEKFSRVDLDKWDKILKYA